MISTYSDRAVYSHLILFLVKLAFHLKYIPGNIPVTASWLPTFRLISLLQSMIVLGLVSEDLCDICSGVLVERLIMLKVTPVSVSWIFTGFIK